MHLIKLKDVSRFYKPKKDKVFYALKEFTFTFPNLGLVSIIGKSGSGKSTLLNIISLIDKPSKGKLYLFDEDTSKWKAKRINRFHNSEIGIVFQNGNLIEKETALFNIKAPLLIGGYSESEANKRAHAICEELNFDQEKLTEKVCNLSGGEKQRVAICRALINNPKIVIADEPTGALDSFNSYMTMNLLKHISKTHLVIMVSHDLNLVESYSDLILKIKDGNLIDIDKRNELKEEHQLPLLKKKSLLGNSWIEKQGLKTFYSKIGKNIVSMVSLTIGLCASILAIGYSSGNKEATIETAYRQIDYGVLSLAHEESQNVAGSKMTLVESFCPNQNEINTLKREYPDLIFSPNLSYFFPSNMSLSLNEEKIENIGYTPIYDFKEGYLDSSLIYLGKMPKEKGEVLINKNAYNLLKKHAKEPLNLVFSLHNIQEVSFLTGKEERPEILDYFTYDEEIKIVGVTDDFSFLSTPKIYYSYKDSLEYLESSVFTNLSLYLGEEVSFYEYMFMCDIASPVRSYSYNVFMSNTHYEEVEVIVKERSDSLKFSSLSEERKNACLSLIEVSSVGMDAFIVIAIIGTILIVGILSFSSYMEERKTIAIYFSLGMDSDDVIYIYLINNLITTVLALIFSFSFAPILENILNGILFSATGIKNLIAIPFTVFLGRMYFLPLIVISFLLIVIILSTFITISGSSKISLKEVLKSE